MEPFDVQCETCHARLRVREERFVGEIHPCPKCSSMVFIAAPVSPTDAEADAAAPAGAAHAIAGTGLVARLAGLVGRHAVAWSVCGAALVISGSLAVSLMFGDDEQVAARADLAAVSPPESIDETDSATESSVENELATSSTTASVDERRYGSAAVIGREGEGTDLPTALPPLPALAADDADSPTTDETVAVDDRSATTGPSAPTPASDSSDNGKSETRRTLRLDPLRFDPSRASLGNATGRMSTSTTPDYPSELDDEATDVSAKPQAADKFDVATQLAVQLESIDVPAMTLADFIRMVSEMAAVPIRLDPAAGVSPQTKVTVRGQDVALGALLDDVLARHGLVSSVRNGGLVIVSRPAP